MVKRITLTGRIREDSSAKKGPEGPNYNFINSLNLQFKFTYFKLFCSIFWFNIFVS